MSKKSRKFLKLLGFGSIAFLAVVLLSKTSNWLIALYDSLSEGIKLVIDLAGIGLIALIFAAVLAPLEALGWWAGWYGDSLDTPANLGTLERPAPAQGEVARYVIYLDGIGQVTFKYLPEGEEFLSQLAAALPDNVRLIRGLMPYSVCNQPLTGDRPLAFFWRWADRLKVKNPQSFVGFFVNLRNMMIVAVSADQRYGPIYNQGTAQVMYNSLLNHGYQPGSGVPLTLIGYSGGGQIALGALPFLKRALAAPIDVISLGGLLQWPQSVFAARAPLSPHFSQNLEKEGMKSAKI